MRFFIGDVRDRDRLTQAMQRHRLRHPCRGAEAGAGRRIQPDRVHQDQRPRRARTSSTRRSRTRSSEVIALSTDKAANPINLYGATKLASDKLFVAANNIAGGHRTRFSRRALRQRRGLARLGRAVLPQADRRRRRPPADHRRAHDALLDHAAAGRRLRAQDFERMRGGEIFVPKIPSVRIVDLAEAMAPDLPHEIVGIRPGEKLHEVMCPADDSHLTLEFDDHFVIRPTIQLRRRGDFSRRTSWASTALAGRAGLRVPLGPEPGLPDRRGDRRDRTVLGGASSHDPYGRQDIAEDDIDAVIDVLRSDFLTQGPAVPALRGRRSRRATAAPARGGRATARRRRCISPVWRSGVGPGDLALDRAQSPSSPPRTARAIAAPTSISSTSIRATWNLSVDALREKLDRAASAGRLPKVVVPGPLLRAAVRHGGDRALAQHYGFQVHRGRSHAIGGELPRRAGRQLPLQRHHRLQLPSGEDHHDRRRRDGVTNDAVLAERMRCCVRTASRAMRHVTNTGEMRDAAPPPGITSSRCSASTIA